MHRSNGNSVFNCIQNVAVSNAILWEWTHRAFAPR